MLTVKQEGFAQGYKGQCEMCKAGAWFIYKGVKLCHGHFLLQGKVR